MAKAIPSPGEAYLGDDPYAMRVLKVSYGDDSDVSDIVPTATNTTGDELVNLSPGVFIYDIAWRLQEAFSAAADLTLGVDSDLDAFAKVSDLDITETAYAWRTMRTQYLNFDSDVAPTDAPAHYTGFFSDNSDQSICVHNPQALIDGAGNIEFYIFYCYIPIST
jgi:hypothetical protein